MFLAILSALALSAAPSLDRQIAAELSRLEGVLDPASTDALRSSQEKWDRWVPEFHQRVAALLETKQATAEDLADVSVEIRQQRLAFLASIPLTPAPELRGGWGDGMTEILLDLDGRGRAKLVRIADNHDGTSLFCLVEGSVEQTADGFRVVPDKLAERPLRLRRQGVALAIEDELASAGSASPHCASGGSIVGAYFPIEGADEIMPWLLDGPFPIVDAEPSASSNR